ncbi:hypothetical protein DBV15_01567 [Temnothorax longispinosus]|uniref:Uncharacterized protein n=1 Tax=Temnothorax longispinosus TaxID=300112 RepID=A0A4V3SBK1_9HYME|nr:hypothetical protein DBV15_01567 [Temnothorax longispinosus]
MFTEKKEEKAMEQSERAVQLSFIFPNLHHYVYNMFESYKKAEKGCKRMRIPYALFKNVYIYNISCHVFSLIRKIRKYACLMINCVINMPSYKLISFSIGGSTALAEPIRFLFIYAGIQFDDERYNSKDWIL